MSDSAMVGQRDSVFERDDVEPLLSGSGGQRLEVSVSVTPVE